MPGAWVEVVRPLKGLLPSVEAPPKSPPVKEKAFWVFGTLLVFLVASQIPLYGIRKFGSGSDPISFYRVMLASNRNSLMELGISPLVTSGMIIQMLVGAKMIQVDNKKPEEQELMKVAEKFVGLIITLGQAVAYTLFGMYGPVSELGVGNAFVIITQLFFSGVLVLMLDDLLSKGYGFGSAISLFISCNICENIFWQTFSYRVIDTPAGPQYEGAVIALFYLLVTRSDKIPALKEAFYRTDAANITNLLATIIVFCVIIYFQGFRIDLPVKNEQIRKGMRGGSYPIKLFYTSNIPIILQSALVSNVFMASQMMYSRMGPNVLTNLLGRWAKTPTGFPIPVGGLVYYMSAPRSLEEVMRDPIHAMAYILFVLSSCAFLSYSWLSVSGSSPKDVAENLRAQKLVIVGHRANSNIIPLRRYIPTAAAFGGLCIGALTIFADFMGAIGSGTGILLAVGNILQSIETIMREQADEGGSITAGFLSLLN